MLASQAEALEHDPEKWEPVFGKRSCSNKEVERDDDSTKNHSALAAVRSAEWGITSPLLHSAA